MTPAAGRSMRFRRGWTAVCRERRNPAGPIIEVGTQFSILAVPPMNADRNHPGFQRGPKNG
jgi:hypothetical protein